MLLPEPKNIAYKALISDIEKGLIKIPQFQREFVWSVDKSAALIDSIIKGYPIGTFITWKTKERLRVVRNLGNVALPDVPDGDFAEYVLDGQQRMTSLYCALNGVEVEREGRVDKFANIFVDLEADEHENIVTTDIDELSDGSYLRLTDLIKGSFKVLAGFDEKYHDKLENYKQTLQSYNFSMIEVKEAEIDVATEIFTRINVGGKPLTLFEIMVAKTYDARKKFDLSEQFNELINRLESVHYNTISDSTVLQTVSLVLTKTCTRKDILKLDKAKFIKTWPSVIDAIERTVDFLRTTFRIPVSQLLPYNTLLAPLAYFFYKHPDKPTGDMRKYLVDFFWRTSLSERYSSGVETKLAQDIKRIDQIVKGKLPKYDFQLDITDESIVENGGFSTGRSFIKALLCILAYHQPKSFIDGAHVIISNDWLKQANSKNYHHFFPKAWLKKNGEEDWWANHIANITIVDDFLNKRKIRDNAPSKYMTQFSKENPELEAHMKTHLIKLDDWGIWEDDYDTFFAKRCKAFAREINKRLVKSA